MGLQLLSLTAADFSSIANHANVSEPGDDLVGPPVPVCWPVSTRKEARTRLRVHMAKQSRRYMSGPSVNYLKVIDDSGSIVSVTRWHWYPMAIPTRMKATGRLIPKPLCPSHGPTDSLNNFILGARDAARCDWIGNNKPCWILMHVVTLPSQRGKGAARLLIQWGIEQAERTGAPARLEAGVMGRPIHEKMGFRQVGGLMELNLRPFGVERLPLLWRRWLTTRIMMRKSLSMTLRVVWIMKSAVGARKVPTV